MPARTRFWSILGRVLDRVSGVFETRVSIQPYKNCSPDTLPIRNKNPYLQLFRFSKSEETLKNGLLVPADALQGARFSLDVDRTCHGHLFMIPPISA
jgi:hypothetical protein